VLEEAQMEEPSDWNDLKEPRFEDEKHLKKRDLYSVAVSWFP